MKRSLDAARARRLESVGRLGGDDPRPLGDCRICNLPGGAGRSGGDVPDPAACKEAPLGAILACVSATVRAEGAEAA